MNEIDRGNHGGWCDLHYWSMPCPVCARTDSNPEANNEPSEVNTLRAQLAALRDERDRAVRLIKNALKSEYWANIEQEPGDFAWLRQLIESEEGQ